MGVVKGVAKHKVNKGVNKALDEMGAVGDVIDKHTTTGPLDAAGDKVDETRKDLSRKKGPLGKKK